MPRELGLTAGGGESDATGPGITFVFTDLEGSSRLWERHPEAMQDALAWHDALLRNAMESQGGFVVKTTGDGLLAAFDDSRAAIAGAVAAQRALRAESWSETGSLRVRIGIHRGVAEWRSGDYYGPDVNRAARLTAVAHGGQIVVSEAAATTVSEQLPTEYALRDLGLHRLRDLADSERVFQVVAPGLVSEFPTLRSSNPQRGNLPFLLSSLVGRDAQVAEDVEILRDKRLVTLTGAAGIGKTHVALRVAAEVAPGLPDGAWLCELAEAQDAESVAELLAATLRIRRGPTGAGLEQEISDFLQGKQILLILDGCERVVEPTGHFLEAVLRRCENVRVIVTSREALGVPGEHVRLLPPLPLPDPLAHPHVVAANEAVRLFVDRAQAVRPSFTIDATNARAVADLCRRVGGIPLAIELAAAKVVAMTPGEVLDALEEPFGLLNGTGVPGLGHHRQTLASAVDWSYALLDDTERSIFNRLGVFSSTFDMVAATEVANGDGIDVAAVPDVVRALVTKSMLVVDESDSEELCFAMLEPLREYARQKISELGLEPTWRRRHAQHYASDMGHDATRTGEWSPERHATSGDLANIRAATNWAIRSLDPGDAELCRALLSSAAGHEHPGVRALAIEGLLSLYQLDHDRGTRTMLELIARADTDTRDVVLRATCILRAPATAVFGWVIANGDNELRRAAAHMLCLNWSAEPSSISALLLQDLAAKVRLWRPARSRVLLEFIAEVTIMTYVSHLEEPGIAEQISAVWREVFTRRLHLNTLNRPLVEGPIAAVAARTLSQRVVEADLMADLQDPREFFEAQEAEKTRMRRIVPLFDPEEDLTPHGDDLHALLDSPILVSRLMATRVLGVHSLANYGRIRGWLDSFFLQATGRARVWMLLAFCLPFSDTPRDWLTDLEGFTKLLLDENRLVIESSDDGSLEDFDFIFLPLALAYAKQGAAMSLINASTRSACDSKDLCMWEHCLVGLGVAGYYSPNAALEALGTVISAAADPLLRSAVVRSLAMIHTLHADRVDDFLVDAGEARLSPLVREQVDFALAKRYLQRVGFYNTSVNNSIHYPRMRLGLTMPAAEILSQVPDTGQYVEMYTRGVLKMLREAHYDLMAWMLP